MGADVAVTFGGSEAAAQAVVARLQGMGVRAQAFQADQSDADQVARLVADVHAAFGGLHILVNNAGVTVKAAVTDEDFSAVDTMHVINTGGVIAAIRAASRLMADNGRIITVSSALSVRSSAPGLTDYSASKAAIDAYSRGAARDLGKRGITVNVVAPGPVRTAMNPDTGPFADFLRSLTALNRYASAEEVAAVIAFLASPVASYITGSTVAVDGGFLA